MVINNEIPESVYLGALNIHRIHLKNVYKTYFAENQVSAVLFPTTALTARPIEGSMETVELNGKQLPTFLTYVRNTDPASNAGIPSLSLPLTVPPASMPIGIELDGAEGEDRKLLAVGAAIEAFIYQQKGGK